jgi:hypothetical protein
VKVKAFEPFGDERYDDYFRVTVGLPAENTCFIEQLDALMSPRRREEPSRTAAPAVRQVELSELA